MCLASLCFLSLILLSRSVMILAGVLKGPVLAAFEKYGDSEVPYSALPELMLWLSTTVLTGGFLIQEQYGLISTPIRLMGIVFLLGAYLAYRSRRFNRYYFRYPAWYFELLDRTTRSERRRIAYMWLHLPRKTRLIYSGNDRAFLEWADFVILSTVNP